MSAMSVGGAVDEAIVGHPSTRRTDIWRSPRLVLEVLTSIARDGLQCLRRAGLPILTISLFAFVLHGWLVDRSARLAIDNGPLGLAVLIAAITVRLSALAICLWLAANAITVNGRPLTHLRPLPTRPGRDVDHDGDEDTPEGSRGQRITDGLRLVMAPMVIVYAAWNLVDWDIHSFLVAKQALVNESIFVTGTNADRSNIGFVSGGWKTYIPWAIGCWLVKLAIDKLNERRDWRLLDVLVVYFECAWVILTWLVLAPSLLVARTWLGTRAVSDWWDSLVGSVSGWSLPFDLSLADLISAAWTGLGGLLSTAASHVVWPLLWVSLIGLIVGWVSLDEITAGRTSSRVAVRNLSRVLDTSTRGLQEKWLPIWAVLSRTLRLGVVPLLTISLAYAALMLAAVWSRLVVTHLLPIDLIANPVLQDQLLRLSQAIIDPLRIALLAGAFAWVVREGLRRKAARP